MPAFRGPEPQANLTSFEVPTIRAIPARLTGYSSFANFIARDNDAAIFKKFARLSARSLLYQQSELHDLERQLEELDSKDANNIENAEARRAAVNWQHFANDGSIRAVERRKLLADIGTKITKYHKALCLEKQVLSIPSPGSRVLRDFRRAFRPGNLPILWGRDRHLFDEEDDLVALAQTDSDRLTLLMKDHLGFLFKERKKEARFDEEGLFYFPEHRIQFAGHAITTLLSAILLIGAIVSLLFTSNKSTGLRVAIVVIFTCLFAIVVGILTSAKRAEVFMSTAAYAAVLVVFIGNIKTV